MNLLNEIKEDLINENAKLANTLRKAKILASQLRLIEFKNWLKYELEGYPNKSSLPKYRTIGVFNYGTFSGPFNTGAKNVVLPTYDLPESVKEYAEHIHFFEGISELEVLLTVEGDSIARKWPQEAIILARSKIKLTGNMELVDVTQPISKSSIAGIIDNIKNKLLDFIIELEESHISLKEGELNTKKRDEIRNLFNINIYGNDNIVATGENVKQYYKKIIKNDIESLIKYLKILKIDKDDLEDLKKAIKNDEIPKDKSFGTKVNEWIGKMIAKASNGLWDISISVAASMITEALKIYYGYK